MVLDYFRKFKSLKITYQNLGKIAYKIHYLRAFVGSTYNTKPGSAARFYKDITKSLQVLLGPMFKVTTRSEGVT